MKDLEHATAWFDADWKDTKNELPNQSGQYVCITTTNTLCFINYSVKYQRFNVFDHDTDYFTIVAKTIDVKQWCEPHRFICLIESGDDL